MTLLLRKDLVGGEASSQALECFKTDLMFRDDCFSKDVTFMP